MLLRLLEASVRAFLDRMVPGLLKIKGVSKWHPKVIQIDALGVRGRICLDLVMCWKDTFFDECLARQKVGPKVQQIRDVGGQLDFGRYV